MPTILGLRRRGYGDGASVVVPAAPALAVAPLLIAPHKANAQPDTGRRLVPIDVVSGALEPQRARHLVVRVVILRRDDDVARAPDAARRPSSSLT